MASPATAPSGNLDAALKLAAQGFPVFPCGVDKRPLVMWKDAATTDPQTIRKLWSRNPWACIGLPTGPASGLYVLDLDVDKETGEALGETTLKQLGLSTELNGVPSVATPSGGKHLYFEYPGPGFGNSAKRIGPGIDTRGEGGYVIAPGSAGPNGAYEFSNGSLRKDTLPVLPQRIVSALSEPAQRTGFKIDTGGGTGWAEAALSGELGKVMAAQEGARNHALNSAAFSLGQIVGGGGLNHDIVRSRLVGTGQAIGLTLQECERTVDSGMTAGAKQPRRPADNGPVGTATPQLGPVIQQAAKRTSKFFCPTDWVGQPVPAREWLVDDLIPMHTVTGLGGDGGTGKSLLALQLAVSTATGKPWLNIAVRQGKTIFLSAEDDEAELQRRLHDVLVGYGIGFEDTANMTLRSLAGEDALLAVDTNLSLVQSELFNELERQANEAHPSLIVIDTLADVYPANENDRAKVRQFVGILRGLALRIGCAVVLLSHPSLTGLSSGSGLSGSTAWNNSVRSRLYMSRIKEDGYEPDPDKRVLRTMKSNYGPSGGEISMRYDAGLFVAEKQPQGLDRLATNAMSERVFLTLLQLMEKQGRYVSAQPGPTYAPSIFAKHPYAEGITKRAFAAGMEGLLSRGKVRIASHGAGAKSRSHLEISRDE